MAKHRARSLRATAGVFAISASLVAGLFVGDAGAATPGMTVQAKNTDVVAKCVLTFNAVNPATLTMKVRFTAQAQAATLAGFGTNTYTQAFCKIYDVSNNLVLQFNPFKNGASFGTQTLITNIPYSPTYTLCGQGFVKKKGGAQSLTPVVCLSANVG
ncbi:MAG: hypothetical protein QOI15_2363 [Pseudonocardiales bacterium]|jgi:hypothetical protein|nr:hypothetical protein [Pseudonocardiales bacterium]